jgi:hypothetical protein
MAFSLLLSRFPLFGFYGLKLSKIPFGEGNVYFLAAGHVKVITK